MAVPLKGLCAALADQGWDSSAVAVGFDRASSPDLDAPKDLPTRLTHCDVVHIHGWGSPTLRNAARDACRAGKPLVISPLGGLGDGHQLHRRWSSRVRAWLGDRKVLRRAAAIAYQNEYERRMLESRGLATKLVQLPYGITTGEYSEPPISGDAGEASRNGHSMLVLGPLHPVEGLVPLLKSLAELGSLSDGWSVVLAGREVDDCWRMLEPAIRRKGGEGRVVHREAEDVDQQRHWLARASLLAAPSLTARCPISVLQAMAAGVPVLATTCVAPPGAEAAIRVCPPQRHELRGALGELLSADDQQRADSASRARDLVRSGYDWSVIAPRFFELYHRVCGESGG